MGRSTRNIVLLDIFSSLFFWVASSFGLFSSHLLRPLATFSLLWWLALNYYLWSLIWLWNPSRRKEETFSWHTLPSQDSCVLHSWLHSSRHSMFHRLHVLLLVSLLRLYFQYPSLWSFWTWCCIQSEGCWDENARTCQWLHQLVQVMDWCWRRGIVRRQATWKSRRLLVTLIMRIAKINMMIMFFLPMMLFANALWTLLQTKAQFKFCPTLKIRTPYRPLVQRCPPWIHQP